MEQLTPNFGFQAESMNDIVTEKINMSISSMLGSYTSNNEYIISEVIKDELFKLKKVKRNAYNNLLFCTTTLENLGTLTFEVAFNKDEKRQLANATLSLLETTNKVNGYVQDTLRTPIGNYTAELNNIFVGNAFKYFNITDQGSLTKNPEYEEVDITDSYIESKIMLEKMLSAYSAEYNNEIYESYFNSRRNLLIAQNTLFSLAVLAKFEQEYNKIKDFFIDENEKDFMTLSELLDKVIQDVRGTNTAYAEGEKQYFEAVKPIMDTLVIAAGTVHDKAMEEAIVKANKSANPKDKAVVIEKKQTEVKSNSSLYGKSKTTGSAQKYGNVKPNNNKAPTGIDKIINAESKYGDKNKINQSQSKDLASKDGGIKRYIEEEEEISVEEMLDQNEMDKIRNSAIAVENKERLIGTSKVEDSINCSAKDGVDDPKKEKVEVGLSSIIKLRS